jgi:hypothetical protein
MTAGQLVQNLGFCVSTIAAIENGDTYDQSPTVLAMAIELGPDLKHLFKPEAARPPAQVLPVILRMRR